MKMTCDVVFYKDLDLGFIQCLKSETGKKLSLDGVVEVARVPMTVDINESAEDEIESLQTDIDRITNHYKKEISLINHKIDSLKERAVA